jgi:hypothetical protein
VSWWCFGGTFEGKNLKKIKKSGVGGKIQQMR